MVALHVTHGRCNDVGVTQVGVSYQHMVMTHSRRGCRYHTDSQPHCLAMTNKCRCRTCRRCMHLHIHQGLSLLRFVAAYMYMYVHVHDMYMNVLSSGRYCCCYCYKCADCARPVKAHLNAGLPGSAVDSTSTLLEYTTAVGSMTSSSSV